MENKRIERVYLMFTREDEEINGGQSLCGYVKLEAFQGKVKINGRIQGLKEYKENNIKLVLFSENSGKLSFYDAGEMTFLQGKYEVNREVDNNYEKKEVLNKVDGAVAIILNYFNGRQNIFCPVVAFKNSKRISYKNELIEFVQPKKEFTINTIKLNNEVIKDRIEKQEKYEIKADVQSNQVLNQNVKSELSPTEAIEALNTFIDVKKEVEKTNIETLKMEDYEENIEDEKSLDIEEKSEYDKYQEMLIQLGLTGKQDESGNICIEPQTELQREMCNECKTFGGAKKDNEVLPLNITKLRMIFNKYFEPFDPFRLKRTDYRWWKVGSPVQLNNLLYQNNIKTPLLFNPQLMMAHFKYRHILIGTYCNRRYRKEYLVCGVPAVYNVDEKPFGDFCRWAQLESTKPRHGAFGYWLVYINIKTGDFLGV